MTEKEIIGILAIVVGAVGQGLYLWQIFRHKVKPHIFSWIVWGLLGLIGFAAQYAANAGPGCWSMGIFAATCFVIAGTGFFYGEKSISRSDWICFFSLLSAIPAWVLTNNPLWAAIIVSIIDAVAFYPTFRKSWMHPHNEGVTAFFIYSVQMVLSLSALDNYNLTTALYPAVILIMNVSLAVVLLYRRRVLA